MIVKAKKCKDAGMVKLILFGLLAGALFSSTFILNEFMSSAGGHWFWSASLRYLFMWLLLTVIITMQHGFGRIKELTAIFVPIGAFGALLAVSALAYSIRVFATLGITLPAG